MIRSSSTPILGSLLSPSPEHFNDKHHQSGLVTPRCTTPSPNHNGYKLSCNNGEFYKPAATAPANSSLNSTPVERSPSDGLLRRVQSEGNLEEMVSAACSDYEVTSPKEYPKKFARKPKTCTLEAIPSFSLRPREEDSEDEEDEEINYLNRLQNMEWDEVRKNVKAYDSMKYQEHGNLYLAIGTFGLSGVGSVAEMGGGGRRSAGIDTHVGDRPGHDIKSIDEQYKKMLDENPNNPLILSNYAQFLYQRKGDLDGAEEYYSRAILEDAGDGEILSQYAKLIWDLHQDKERAAGYFQRALQASSQDSHVRAAYANFLWDVQDDENGAEGNEAFNSPLGMPAFYNEAMASLTT